MLNSIPRTNQVFKISIQGVEVFTTTGAEDTAAIVHTLASRSCVNSFTVSKAGTEPFIPPAAVPVLPPPVPNKPGPKPKQPEAKKAPAPPTNTRKRKEAPGPVSSDIAEDLWVSAGGNHENDHATNENESE